LPGFAHIQILQLFVESGGAAVLPVGVSYQRSGQVGMLLMILPGVIL
jgi:hypothetical protein